ncbi:MAG TPA: hypothetical protein VGY49_16290 [Burkholderiaceae bacterium]|jgi:hypothetical protein|nr:hypothetical protein [Burkholderiaceae bacterium]
MKLMRAVLSVMVCANAMLAGCASTSNVADNGSTLGPGVDEKRVARVEAAARRANVDVHWVNYPRLPGQ